MKIKLEVNTDDYERLARELTALGIIIDDDAEYVLSARNCFCGYVCGRKNDKSCHIAADDIIFIESFGHDIIIHATDGEYKSSERLHQFEAALNPADFLRISNSVIIAKKKVKRIKAALSQKFTLTLTDGSTVDVTRSYYYIFKNTFNL